jgi:ABC-type bacteriocin/lantibiotic exporter with double-glycine peptidase domain
MGEVRARRGAAWRFVRAVVRAQAGGVTGAVVSGLLWQTGAVAAPLIVKYAIDHGIVTRDHHALLVWLLALLGVGLLEVAAGGMRHIYAIRNRSAADARVRDAIFAHALRLDPAYHDRVGPGELMSRASSDSEHVARMMDAIGHTIGYVLTVVAVSVVMLAIDVELALFVLIPLPVISVGAWIYSRRYDVRTRLLQESWANAATLVEETVSGIRIVKGLGAGRPLSARFRRRSDELVRRGLDVARLDAVFNPALEALPLVGTVAVLWLGGRRVISGAISRSGRSSPSTPTSSCWYGPCGSWASACRRSRRRSPRAHGLPRCWRRNRVCASPAARVSCRDRCAETCAWKGSASGTKATAPCSTVSTCMSPRASRSPSSARPGPARAQSPAS